MEGREAMQESKLLLKLNPINETFEKPSRQARGLLDLQMTDARALKNRLKCHTIRELVTLYQAFERSDKLDKLNVAFKDCLLLEKRTNEFVNKIARLAQIEADKEKIAKTGKGEVKSNYELIYKLLQEMTVPNFLEQVLSIWHHDLRDTSNQWPSLSIFLKLGLDLG